MNERITLQDLIDLLAKQQEMTKKDAETFLREFFAIVAENIEAGESVKVKDFGAFKIVKVSARKSVDVNTGEAIEIPAHYKLSFTPDKLLKEAINRPFAHFESVILEEGVTFDNIESEFSEEKEANADVEEDVSIEEDITEYITEEPIADNEKEIEKNTEESETITELDSQPEEQSEPQPEDVSTPMATYVDGSLEENETKEESTDVTEPEQIKAESESEMLPTEAINEQYKQSVSDNDADFEAEDTQPPKKKHMKYVLALVVFTTMIGTATVGLVYNQGTFFLPEGSAEKQALAKAVDSKTLVDDTKAVVKDTISPPDLSLPPDTVWLVPPRNPEGSAETYRKPPVAPSAPATNMALGTEIIKSGHTLRNIALKYYGNKSFWVYIYEENKSQIENPNNVPIGTRLRIPSPSKYGINADDKESVKKAKELEEKLFSKMGL